MSISKVQKGDSVKVISGKFKGTLGTITKVIKSSNSKGACVAVDNVNKLIKYTKSNKAYGMQGQMVQVDRFIDSSNVALVDDKNNISKTYISTQNNKKTRLFRTTNAAVPKVKVVTKEKKELSNEIK
jgi:large subunit ribosomal protein L24